MISRLEGELTAVREGRAELNCGHVWYELLIPAHDAQTLSAMIGEAVEFHCIDYLEAQGQGSAFVPRLVGFRRPEDRAFFELFTTVKGLGTRKALRALQLPFGTVAAAIAEKDIEVLISLPEIGRRTAETIVAELHGKVDRFVELKPDRPGPGGPAPTGAQERLLADATAVLVQLGEPRLPARHLVERAARADPEIDTAEALVAAAFRLKGT